MADYRELQPTKTIKEIELTYHQDRFIFSKADYDAFVGGWGSGKTEAAILKIMKLANESPGSLWLICRKEFTDLKDSTMPDFERYTGIIIGGNKTVKLPNGATIMFRHAKELNILKNTNLSGFCIEQGEEFETDEQYWYLVGRVRRDGTAQVCRIVIANTNGHNWIWKLFKLSANNDGITRLTLPHPITKEPTEFRFQLIEGSTFECNPKHLPNDYLANLAVVQQKQPDVYRRYVLNSWEEADASNHVLPESILRKCIGRKIDTDDDRKIVSCDGSRGGADRTVIMGLDVTGRYLAPPKIMRAPETDDSMVTAGHIIIMKTRIGGEYIVNDSQGLGGPIADRLREQGQKCHDIISSAREGLANPERFFNIRDEMWWTLREKIQAGEVSLPDDEELISELSAVKYKPDSMGRIKIESNDDIKARLGKSPDMAVSYVMGHYGFKFVPIENQVKKPGYHSREPVSSGAGWLGQ